jgi:hypothetical protein
VNAHAVSFRKGGGFQVRSLREALAAADFDRVVNDGKNGEREAAQLLIPAAVESSLNHMRELRKQHETELIPLLRVEERRLRNWRRRREELLQSRIEKFGPSHPKSRRYQKDLEEMESWLKDREDNWRDTHFTAATDPSTQLVLVIEGVR